MYCVLPEDGRSVDTCLNEYYILKTTEIYMRLTSYFNIVYIISQLNASFFLLRLSYQYSSSSSSAQQPLLSQGPLQKLLPAVAIPCSIPPVSLPQLPGIFHHTILSWSNNICNDFDLYRDKTFHEPILRSLNRFIGCRISDSPAIAFLDFVTIFFPE